MEPVVEGRDLVIKVKYGDLLKRFGAYVRGSSVDHDMYKLRRKIMDLFKFNPYDDLILKYVDEDGDVVSLDNDDELLDAVITQRLNPLRINVQLKSDIATASDVKHEVLNYKHAGQPQVEQQPLKSSSTIHEEPKSPMDPLFNGLDKDPIDFLARALPALPLPELMDTFAKIGRHITQPASNSMGESSGTSGDTTTRSKNASVPVSTPPADPFPVQLQRALSQAAVEFMKMAISTISQVPNNSSGEPSEISNEEATKSAHLYKEEPKPSIVPSALQTSSGGVPVHFQKRHESVNLSPGGSGSMMIPFTDLNLDACEHPHVSNSEGYSLNDDILSSGCASKKNVDYDDKSNRVNCHGKSVMLVAPPPMPSQKVEEQTKDGVKPTSAPSYGDGISCLMDGGKRKISTNTTMYPANPDFCFDSDASVNHHIGSAVPDLHIPSTFGLQLHGRSRRKTQGYSDRHTFHQGVRCDGCGMFPIVGPRFKSKVKEDYDLCSICLSQMGNVADYNRIDKTHPLSSHRMFKEYKTLSRRKMYPHLPGIGAKNSRVKLDSCFVQDVTILDGTVMPPSTPFTKIWRMCNNGSIQWPYGTHLEWIGGDKFSVRRADQLEMPVWGCQVDKEIDIAADFVSPQIPGSYTSYWRLTSPSGQRFGQHVWVAIQVVSPYSSNEDINLNLPPEGINADGLGVIDANAEPLVGAPFEHHVNGSDELEAFGNQVPVGNTNLEPFGSQVTVGNANLQPSDNQVQSGSVNVDSIDNENPHDIAHPDNNNVVPQPIPAVTPSSSPLLDIPSAVTPSSSPLLDIPPAVNPLSYPSLDIPLSPLEESVTADVQPSETETDSVVEQTLMRELEDMGFKHIDLNKEILRKNDYDLEQSVEDLCGFAEWDVLLEELQEMGFSDRSKNKKLLEKNGGSIKQVVMDLIAEENK